MNPEGFTLDDKYVREEGRIYLSGVQALVRVPLVQRWRDRRAGLNTAGFISGYRGSPLGTYDTALGRARSHLNGNSIHFQPGINEDLAATAIWGTQQINLLPGARVDGVFSIWYGKGPGADRSADVLKHGNSAGSARLGGVLAIVGDDHGCQSSTLAHQSEHIFQAAMMPVLHPATIEDYLEFGVLGFALSRFSGCWIGLKTVSANVDSSASIAVRLDQPNIVLPEFEMPPGGLNIRWPDPAEDQERRLHGPKMAAVAAFARANAIDRIVLDSRQPRLGIAAAGKAYLDLRQALDDLAIDEAAADRLGIRVLKIGMSWPLEADAVRRFADGVATVLVVEEKRSFIEDQLVRILYSHDAARRPSVIGKRDANGAVQLPSTGELTTPLIARAVVSALVQLGGCPAELQQRLAGFESRTQSAETPVSGGRIPYFCSGCPHNTSTQLPEGSRALAGIGCHGMVMQMPERRTILGTHMGGEGATWIGHSPFVSDSHVFQNIGDGTYQHSGLLAIRAAAVAGVNITYKILYNDAVAMTGGQPVEGHPDVATIARQVSAEGAKKVVVVSEDPRRLAGANLPASVDIHHRRELHRVQRELRAIPGLTVLVYDQTCAAEKRRRRKRGLEPTPDKRVLINETVCDGCGDCTERSNCISIVPVETPLGRKRAIDLSNCNFDYTCLDGFCPSFVTVSGGKLRCRDTGVAHPAFGLSLPEVPRLSGRYDIFVAGIGGSGIVTLGGILGMAAHLEGHACTVLDVTGLAQKNGPVFSQVRLAPTSERLHASRIGPGQTDLLLGCDIVVASGAAILSTLGQGSSRAIVNSHIQPTAAFVMDGDLDFQQEAMQRSITSACGEQQVEFIPATEWATSLTGDAIATNMFMLGYAFQKGLLPLQLASLLRAIELNGTAVEDIKRTFAWGRRVAADPAQFTPVLAMTRSAEVAAPGTLTELIAFHAAHLAAYQDERYAMRYRSIVEKLAEAERVRARGNAGLAEAVARNLAKLMSYKDEYEVARLYTDGRFQHMLDQVFEGDTRIEIHLAPPWFARRDRDTGRPIKRAYGPWIMPVLSFLARMKWLRGSILDPFSYSHERRLERKLITDYEALIDLIAGSLTAENHNIAVELAELAGRIRGFGHIKENNALAAKARERELLRQFHDLPSVATAAA